MSDPSQADYLVEAEDTIRETLGDSLRKHNYEKPNVEIKRITTDGANYSSYLFLITVSEDGKETIDLFSKTSCMNGALREKIDASRFFIAELDFYQGLLRRFGELQEKYQVPNDKRLVYPKFFGCNTERCKETLILQNMKAEGYEDPDRFKSVKWEEAAASVETLARFHALAFAYQKQNPKDYLKHTKDLTYFNTSTDGPGNFINLMYETGIKSVNDKYRAKIEALIGTDAAAKMQEVTTPSGQSVLVHGDYRPSNLLFKKQGSKVHVIPIDYQTLHNGRPTTDLFYFITLGTDGRFRAQYHEQLLDHYYQELCAAMRRLDVDPDEVYPRKKFESDLKAVLPAAVIFGVGYLSIILVEVDKAPQITPDVEWTQFCVAPNQAFVERLEELCEDFARWGAF